MLDFIRSVLKFGGRREGLTPQQEGSGKERPPLVRVLTESFVTDMRNSKLTESWPATRKAIDEMLANPGRAVLEALTSVPREVDVL